MTTRALSQAMVVSAMVSAAVVSCSSKPKGELMVVVDTDLSAGVDFDHLYIEVTSPAPSGYHNLITEFGQPGQVVAFPATFAIVGNNDPGTRIHIRVSTGSGTGAGASSTNVGAPRTDREIDTTIPADRVAMLRMKVGWLCYGEVRVNPMYMPPIADNICTADGQTCIAGACTTAIVDSSLLPNYDDGAVFGGKPPRGGGACFDTLPCFSAGSAQAVDMQGCSIQKPAGGSGVNVAIATPLGSGGICNAQGCLVPLDSDGDEWGFTVANDRINLPAAVCTRIKQGRALAVVTSTSCPTKTQGTPTCGLWSELGFDASSLDAPSPANIPKVVDARAD